MSINKYILYPVILIILISCDSTINNRNSKHSKLSADSIAIDFDFSIELYEEPKVNFIRQLSFRGPDRDRGTKELYLIDKKLVGESEYGIDSISVSRDQVITVFYYLQEKFQIPSLEKIDNIPSFTIQKNEWLRCKIELDLNLRGGSYFYHSHECDSIISDIKSLGLKLGNQN